MKAIVGIALSVMTMATGAAGAPLPAAGATLGGGAGPATKPGDESPLSSRLLELAGRDLRSAPHAAQARALSLPAHGPGSLIRSDGKVLVEVRVTGTARSRASGIAAAGAEVTHVSPRYDAVTAAVSTNDLRALAAAPGVAAVTEVLEPMIARENASPRSPRSPIAPGPEAAEPINTCEGSVTSQGDAQLGAATARTRFNVDGSGVEVGVLSDSFGLDSHAATSPADDVATGDLPGPGNPCGRTDPVDVLDDSGAGADEGRAMLQIVHDLAPGARLSFATAFTGETQFADNIRRLAAAGADVITDDVYYLDEPSFQDGLVAGAINDVTAAGVTYYSSAGNNNIISAGKDVASWEAPAFRLAPSCPAGLPDYATQCMDFDPGAGTDNTYGFRVAAGAEVMMALQWAQPQFGVTTDLDIYMLSGSTVIAEGDYSNPDGTEQPFEYISFANAGGEAMDVNIAIDRYTAGAGDTGTPRLKLIHLNNGDDRSVPTEYSTSAGGDVVGPTIFGHTGAANAMSAAAVPRYDSATVEPYSSRGPVTHYFGPVDGTTPAAPLAAPQQIAKPDIAATDGVQTTFFGSFYYFYGTSAAAPHAAAVAALQLDANPAQTVAQVKSAQKATADPVGSFGASAAGAGLVDAIGAVGSNPPPPPTVTITPPETAPDPTPAIAFATTGDLQALSCAIDDGLAQPCSSPFTPAPLADGDHTITVAASDYFDQTGSDTEAFTVGTPPSDTTPPETTIDSGPAGTVESADVSFTFSSSEPGSSFECRLDGSGFSDCTNPKAYTGLADGTHSFRVRAGDAAGNTDPTPAVRTFTVSAGADACAQAKAALRDAERALHRAARAAKAARAKLSRARVKLRRADGRGERRRAKRRLRRARKRLHAARATARAAVRVRAAAVAAVEASC